MAFSVKDWKDYPDTSTPLSQAALEDLETRLSGYTDTVAAGAYSGTAIPDSKLSSPNNSVLRSIAFVNARSFGAGTTGTYWVNAGADSGIVGTLVSSGNASTTSSHAQGTVSITAADYSTTLTTKLRLRADCYVNATAPGYTLKVGLYPLTVAGGTNLLSYTLGTLVTGSQVTFTTPSASTTNTGQTSDFSLPSDGHYILGVETTSGGNANTLVQLIGTLQMHSV